MRADLLLVEVGHASTRSQAQRLIASGVQWRLSPDLPWKRVLKNGEDIPAQAIHAGLEMQLLDTSETKYVSRGGLKLEAALLASGVDVRGLECLDVGQSTGGFTDCLLQAGAQRIVGVDVGHDQLHQKLRLDPRVICIEGLNARHLCPEHLPQADFDFITGDLSFISLSLVLPALIPLLRPEANLLLLVKPQFELQPAQIGKGGIVRDDPALYAQVEQRICAQVQELGREVRAWFPSTITGGDGNREFFLHA